MLQIIALRVLPGLCADLTTTGFCNQSRPNIMGAYIQLQLNEQILNIELGFKFQ